MANNPPKRLAVIRDIRSRLGDVTAADGTALTGVTYAQLDETFVPPEPWGWVWDAGERYAVDDQSITNHVSPTAAVSISISFPFSRDRDKDDTEGLGTLANLWLPGLLALGGAQNTLSGFPDGYALWRVFAQIQDLGIERPVGCIFVIYELEYGAIVPGD